MNILKFFLTIILAAFLISSCNSSKEKIILKYNLVTPQNNIYVITQKDVSENEIKNNIYEKVSFHSNKPIRIERCDKNGKLTDDLFVSAITAFEYSKDGNVKFVKYFDKNLNPSPDKKFGFASIEYVYDELNRVRMEIYRDKNFKLLQVPIDNSGNFAKVDFLSPILVYEYFDFQIKIKALDQNFNLLKEVVGEKPCIPFVDCGE
ncbi:MAG: hypothetical protein WAR79_04445 [Melioribacteraceae bacterium]